MAIDKIPSVALDSGVPTRAQLPAGCILQVVQTAYTTTDSTSSSTPVNTGCVATITPTSATSKILATLNMPIRHQANGQNAFGRISRNSNAAVSGLVQDFYAPTGSGICGNVNITWLDSPATTSVVTYTAQFGVNNGGTININSDFNNVNNGVTYLTLMEIAA